LGEIGGNWGDHRRKRKMERSKLNLGGSSAPKESIKKAEEVPKQNPGKKKKKQKQKEKKSPQELKSEKLISDLSFALESQDNFKLQKILSTPKLLDDVQVAFAKFSRI
jgi:hypothetical protein